MKYTKILLLVTLAVLAMGCKKDKKKGLDITGTWELVDMKTKAIQIGEETIEVTIVFKADNTFSLSQMLGQGRPVAYSGTWQLDGTRLSGKYSDGKSWGAAYQMALDGSTLTMTPEIANAESYIYHKK